MKTLVTILALVILTSSLAMAGQTDHTKILLHGTKTFSDSSSWGLGGWVVLPDPGSEKMFTVVGPRYSTQSWWIEFMVGTLTVEQEKQSTIDIRTSYSLLDPILTFGEITYYPKTGDWYSYFEIDYKLLPIGLIGFEAESDHPHDATGKTGFGPHLKIPFGDQFVIMGTYQWHQDDDQTWIRVIIDF